ncbi:nuclear transport factor 2 family protein [Arthrobacter sp. AZCC_0090]|uniref:nuclear transport factor 2 family protein n=1 Tax=Arthrobacter sp. AZCC_0090 TaxID=2735881 RepID=UPI00160962E5|nr:nuclear transport factor 2 family protein [Arthrobacter sp. AZCC_0090]MBB6407186.1 hypothetical protein [Arthrobacter sp. AZCC_0090]
MTARRIPLEDRLNIQDLYARQSHAIDGGDAAGWARTYTVDGSFISPTFNLTAVGHEELEKFAQTSNDSALARGEQLRHWLNSLVLRPRDADTIDANAYLLILATSVDGTRIDRSLRIEDVITCVGGEWLFISRTVFRDAS